MFILSREENIAPPTEREIDILRLIKTGITYEEIGKLLFISTRTVRYYASNIQDKLGAKNRMEAVSKGIEKGWIE